MKGKHQEINLYQQKKIKGKIKWIKRGKYCEECNKSTLKELKEHER